MVEQQRNDNPQINENTTRLLTTRVAELLGMAPCDDIEKVHRQIDARCAKNPEFCQIVDKAIKQATFDVFASKKNIKDYLTINSSDEDGAEEVDKTSSEQSPQNWSRPSLQDKIEKTLQRSLRNKFVRFYPKSEVLKDQNPIDYENSLFSFDGDVSEPLKWKTYDQ